MPKASRKAALEALRARRNGLVTSSRTDDYEVQDAEDIYDVVEENEYRDLVERRRERENFVVDDDGLGYHDDGEENHFAEETKLAVKAARKRETEAHQTAKALKKARRSKSLTTDDAASTKSMWDFVKPGAGIGASNAVSRSSVLEERNSHNRVNQDDLDSLLQGLDNVSSSARRRIVSGGMTRSRSGRSRSRRGVKSSRNRSVSRRAQRTHHNNNDSENDEDYEEDNNDGTEFINATEAGDGDDCQDVVMEEAENIPNEITKETESLNKDLDAEAISKSDDESKLNVDVEDTTGNTSSDEAKTVDNEMTSPKPKKMKLLKTKRSRFTDRMSAAAKEAHEKQTKETIQQNKTVSELKPAMTATSAPGSVNKNSASFNPTSITSAPSNVGAHTSRANLDSIIQETTIGDESRSFVDMYWTDIYEKNGVVHLYGKTPKTVGSKDFVSICTVVSGNQHNLFVLPREGADTMAVYNELKSVLQPKCIPLVKGAEWGAKKVKRKYAFGDGCIPREETEYLKVVYDAKYAKPEEEVCVNGGENFVKILNAGATALETFILKRKLMGPCWVRVYDPMPTCSNVSWCKIECTINTPKNLTRCDLAKEKETIKPRPAPPLTTVTMKLKTVVNPKTNKSEIISVAAICHQNINIDSSTIESRENMSQISLIRPLGLNISSISGGLPHLPRDLDSEIKASLPGLLKMPNERALLNRLLAQIGIWDPDVLVGHNAWGYDMEVLLSRCVENKAMGWSKLGRRRFVPKPKGNFSGKEWLISDTLKGRLLCDTYVSSKELLRETTYSLTNLAKTQLKCDRVEIEPVDIPQWFNTGSDVVKLALHTLHDAELVQRLMLKLQVIPLTKQLTSIAGNLWGRTMKGNRAERNEYLLLHEFHQLKFIVPEKKRKSSFGAGKSKAKYSGGLVLEPKKGLYDTFILLLDFNSLYPSIVQEYNLCFTTMNWSEYVIGGELSTKSNDADMEDTEANNISSTETLPPLPEESLETGVLPRVIKTLVQRRRQVKKILKQERNPDKQQELDIRQMALKLTANSMYGCLGFSHSRFYAQPIAALITAMGRDILQRSVTIAQDTVGLDVIYGDTDSIMINTRISGKDLDQLKVVHDLGATVKREVNKLYKTLELEIDGVFRSMLLLKKKKYAAVTISTSPDGVNVFGTEMKGLDLVRRDWCIQSKDTGKYVLDQILSGQEREEVVSKIHTHLEELATKMRSNELSLDKYVITKGLSKHPDQYPDGKSQPHVQVAKMMLKAKRAVNTGDHIPYVITQSLDQDVEMSGKKIKTGAAERARHPEEIQRSAGTLKPDIEWYLTQQILPPISRLCESIDGTSQAMIAAKLGLDASRFNQCNSTGNEIDDSSLVQFTPASFLPDKERFSDVEKFFITCRSCHVSNELRGVFTVSHDGNQVMSGYQCPNSDCKKPNHWGYESHYDLLNVLSNKVTSTIRKIVATHGRYEHKCEDPSCELITSQLSVSGKACLSRGCNGSLKPSYSASQLDTQLKYLKSLFDLSHCYKQYVKRCKSLGFDESSVVQIQEVKKMLSTQDQVVAEALCDRLVVTLRKSAYNIIEPDIFQKFFAV